MTAMTKRAPKVRAPQHEANISAKAGRGLACLREIVRCAGADPDEPLEERAAWRFLQRELIGANNPTLWWWIAQSHERLFPGLPKPTRFDESREVLFRELAAEVERLDRATMPMTEERIAAAFEGLT